MDINTLIFSQERVSLSADESKIPWDEPAFSQRMLENHLSQDHDWASRRLSPSAPSPVMTRWTAS